MMTSETAFASPHPPRPYADLRIAHERWGRSSTPSLNGQLHYPADIDRPLHDAAADKILQYRADYNNLAASIAN